MEITNKKERNNAFFQFIVIFLGSILIVNVALFFDYTFPAKQVKALKSENTALKKNKSSNVDLLKFYVEIEALVSSEDGYIPRKKVDDIQVKINKVITEFPDDELVKKVNAICYKLLELNTKLDDYKEILDECRGDLKKCKKDFEEYKEEY